MITFLNSIFLRGFTHSPPARHSDILWQHLDTDSSGRTAPLHT